MSSKFKVYDNSTNKLLKTFGTRKDAVFWCKVNQKGLLLDAEWGDDYRIIESDR